MNVIWTEQAWERLLEFGGHRLLRLDELPGAE